MKHTQGPWSLAGTLSIVQKSRPHIQIAKAQKSGCFGHKFVKGEAEANAMLLAAAPELYEELREMVFFLQNFDPASKKYDWIKSVRIEMAKDVLKMANGEA